MAFTVVSGLTHPNWIDEALEDQDLRDEYDAELLRLQTQGLSDARLDLDDREVRMRWGVDLQLRTARTQSRIIVNRRIGVSWLFVLAAIATYAWAK